MKNKLIKTGLALVTLLLLALAGLALLAKPAPAAPFFENQPEVLVMAHRGGRQLWPENTLYAFQQATALGVEVLEMDVHSTRDGAIVLLHDETVDRTTDGTGSVQDFSLTELQALDAGYQWSADDGASFPYRGQGIQIPTLAEVFQALPGYPMNIEIKQSQPDITAAVCDLIRQYQVTDQVLIASFDMDTIRTFRETCPEVATTLGEDEVRLLYGLSLPYLGALFSPPGQAVQVPEYWGDTHVLTPRFIQAAHNRGLQVHAWTINDPAEMQRFLDLGVDGIITDRPDLLLELLKR